MLIASTWEHYQTATREIPQQYRAGWLGALPPTGHRTGPGGQNNVPAEKEGGSVDVYGFANQGCDGQQSGHMGLLHEAIVGDDALVDDLVVLESHAHANLLTLQPARKAIE